MKPQECVDVLTNAWDTRLVNENNKRGSWTPKNVYASRVSDCIWQMVLDMVKSDSKPPFGAMSLNRMLFGREVEDFFLRELARAGKEFTPSFELVNQQERVVIKDRKGRVIITGKKDVAVRFEGMKATPPAEVKFGQAVSRIEHADDFKGGRWTKHMPRQLLSYMYAKNEPLGFMFLPKIGGFLPIPFLLEDHLEEMELALANATAAMDLKEEIEANGGTLSTIEPNQIPYCADRTYCPPCDYFNTLCFPPMDYGEGADVLGEEVSDALEIMHINKAARKAYNHAEKVYKSKVKGIPLAMAGRFLVTGKWAKGWENCQEKSHKTRLEQGSWRTKWECVEEPETEESAT